MNKLIPSEYHECQALVQYLELLKKIGKVKLFTHIANETTVQSWALKSKRTAQGVRKGFPDYVVVTIKGIVFIEMKRSKGGITSPEQMEWLKALRDHAPAVVCNGFEQAKEFLDEIIKEVKE